MASHAATTPCSCWIRSPTPDAHFRVSGVVEQGVQLMYGSIGVVSVSRDGSSDAQSPHSLALPA